LIKSFNWIGILSVRPDGIHFLVITDRAQSVRSICLALISGVGSAYVLLAIWTFLIQQSLLAFLRDASVAWAWAILSLATFFVGWILGIIGGIYLLDFLTLHLQARYTTDVALLEPKELRLGTFRHILKVSVQKYFFPERELPHSKLPVPTELQFTIRPRNRGSEHLIPTPGNS